MKRILIMATNFRMEPHAYARTSIACLYLFSVLTYIKSLIFVKYLLKQFIISREIYEKFLGHNYIIH